MRFGKVYLGGTGETYIEFDPNTSTFSNPSALNTSTPGVAVGIDNHITTGRSNGGVDRHDASGALVCQTGAQSGTGHVRGAVHDQNGDIWFVHLNNNNVSKYDADCNPMGVFPVCLAPYTYSGRRGYIRCLQHDSHRQLLRRLR